MTTLKPLSTPNHDILALIEAQPNLAASTKRQYQKAIGHYLDAGHQLTDAEALQVYAGRLPKSSRAFLKAALRLWTEQLALSAKSAATPENLAAVTATLYRLEALNEAIPASAVQGQKVHLWLSQREVKRLLDQCGADLLGQRDRIVLGLLVGAGLRRREMCDQRFADILTQPGKDNPRTVLNIHGKGARDRVVPISARLAAGLQAWAGRIGGPEGRVARSVNKGGRLGERLGPVGLFRIVAKAGAAIGQPALAPHSLRRTYAQLGYEAGIPITQISTLLGHSSVATTQRYLNLALDLETTISDFIPF